MYESDYEKHRTNLAKRWYEKGKAENDPFDKVIYLWISYNALYGNVYGKSEKDRAIRCADEIFAENLENGKMLLATEDAQYFGKRVITNCKNIEKTTEEQRDIIANCDYSNYKSCANTMESLIACIYQVRCNLFHGDKTPCGPADLSDDAEIVTHAGNALQGILDMYYSEEN